MKCTALSVVLSLLFLLAPPGLQNSGATAYVVLAGAINSRSFVFAKQGEKEAGPKLILLGGAPGTGKSTFGMSIALDQGILKCIGTDTVRAVMRSYVSASISPALHRSSYAAAQHHEDDDDPVTSWLETCEVLESSIEETIDDALHRGNDLVLEGVSLVPSTKWIQKWEEKGGQAIGVLLHVPDAEIHRSLLIRRGSATGQTEKEKNKLGHFDRIRKIQNEMVNRAKESKWLLIEQKIQPDPLEMVASELGEYVPTMELYKQREKIKGKSNSTAAAKQQLDKASKTDATKAKKKRKQSNATKASSS
jgi:2-phosphoglycerate kinase